MINFTVKTRPVGNRFDDCGKELVCPDAYYKKGETDFTPPGTMGRKGEKCVHERKYYI